MKKVDRKNIIKVISILFWLLFWHIISSFINSDIILPKPIQVFSTVLNLIFTKEFWIIILNSSSKIIFGFVLALIVGIVFAIISSRLWIFDFFISIPMKLIKASPIASFIILALLWVKGKNLSILVSFLMVMPIIYTNVKEGIKETDKKLIEMSKVFGITRLKKVQHIYIPSIIPYLSSAITVGLSFCFKSGIAAEVIGIPKRTIGYNLYEAKLNLMTKEVLAWTIVIIIISFVFEYIVFYVVRKWGDKWINT